MSRRDRDQSVRIALGGMLGAGSLVILWLACIVPSGWLGLTAVAGLFPVTATLYAGRAAGYMCWAAGSLLGLVLLPNKGIPLLYLVFLGLYPVVKSRIEGLRRGAVEWLLKLIFFNVALILCWFLFQGLLLPDPPQWLEEGIAIFFAGGNLVFICYDIGLSRLIGLLGHRLSRGGRR